MELPTTRELKKHATRPGGGAEMGSLVGRTCSKAVDPTDGAGLAEQETKDSKPLAVKECGRNNVQWREKLPIS